MKSSEKSLDFVKEFLSQDTSAYLQKSDPLSLHGFVGPISRWDKSKTWANLRSDLEIGPTSSGPFCIQIFLQLTTACLQKSYPLSLHGFVGPISRWDHLKMAEIPGPTWRSDLH